MEWLVPLITLILLEVVLGLDNVIFISIVANRLPVHQQRKARIMGLILAMFLRLGLLGLISLILQLQGNLFTVFSIGISGKDLILIGGGLFLIYKSSTEIHHKMEGEEGDTSKQIKATSFKSVIFQILLLDLVFSIDSIITAVGMVDELWIMYTAVIVTVGIMLFAAEPISRFVNNHPAFKMLALSFLLLIGVSLIAEGLDFHIPKGYIYFSMGFAFLVDVLQMRMGKKSGTPVRTKEHYVPEDLEAVKDSKPV
ncbi:TerC family protein [Segetibacter sp. 3557_3]|uniref:TerC family protein n=1 Tax=Segetibacter sp. 3557_3 TaxID=2547429 RepID=UPI00105903EE|nr:TerC family protein [Segetibacter sp. 3557_3]TDH26416.1 TerC family protein [Segetibacter sp. 3557_3]